MVVQDCLRSCIQDKKVESIDTLSFLTTHQIILSEHVFKDNALTYRQMLFCTFFTAPSDFLAMASIIIKRYLSQSGILLPGASKLQKRYLHISVKIIT